MGKIKRWHLPGVEAMVGSSISRNLCSLRTLVSPRVQSACFSTIWNRWCTPRRFQRRGSEDNRCLLGCGGCAEDSIEHYARCRAVRRTADSYLALGSTGTIDIEHFLLAADVLRNNDDALVCIAVLIYATYTSTNTIRAKKNSVSHDSAFEMLKQNCRDAVMGHRGSSKVIDSRWFTGDRSRRRIA